MTLSDEMKERLAALGDDPLPKLLGGKAERPGKLIPFPGELGKAPEDGGKGLSVVLWSLGLDELTNALAAALKHCDALGLTQERLKAEPEIWDMELKCQQLVLVLRHPAEPTKPLVRNANTIRMLEPGVIEALYKEVLTFTSSRNPGLLHVKTFEELDEVIVDLGKGLRPAKDYLSSFDFDSLVVIARELAARWLKQTRERLSDSFSQNDSST